MTGFHGNKQYYQVSIYGVQMTNNIPLFLKQGSAGIRGVKK